MTSSQADSSARGERCPGARAADVTRRGDNKDGGLRCANPPTRCSNRRRISDVRKARNERGIWQRRFWEHLIRDDADYARHVEYCYINPVKHGSVSKVRDWPHSSFHRDVRVGVFPDDWAGDVHASGQFGEEERCLTQEPQM